MTYYTSVTGEIRIDPPLRGQALDGTLFADPYEDGYAQRCICLEIVEEAPYTDPGAGAAPVWTAHRVISADVECLEAFDMEAELQELIDTFPGHTFTGRLQCMGDNRWSDMWGVIVHDGRAKRVRPTVTWPGDSDAGT